HALVRAGLVLVTRILVGMRGDENGVTLDLGRQRDRATHLRAGPLGRLDDLAGRTVDQTMIERLEPNPDLLVRHDGVPSLKSDGRGLWDACPGMVRFVRPVPLRTGSRARRPPKARADQRAGLPRRKSIERVKRRVNSQ